MAEEIILDVCGLEPPEPYELATAALKDLTAGQYLKLTIPRRPQLLYPWLEENNFIQVTREISEDMFELYIWKSDDADMDKYIKILLTG